MAWSSYTVIQLYANFNFASLPKPSDFPWLSIISSDLWRSHVCLTTPSCPPPLGSSLRWTLGRWSTGRLCPDFKDEKQKSWANGAHVSCWCIMLNVRSMLHGENAFSPRPQHVSISGVLISVCDISSYINIPNMWKWTSSYLRHSSKH